MRTINLMLPDALHERILKMAKKNRVSLDLLVAAALAEKLLMLGSDGHLGERSEKRRAPLDSLREQDLYNCER